MYIHDMDIQKVINIDQDILTGQPVLTATINTYIELSGLTPKVKEYLNGESTTQDKVIVIS